MLKYAIAGAMLLIGLAASGPAAVAAPPNEECVNCAPPKPYDTESPARIRQEMDRPMDRPLPNTNIPAQRDPAASPVRTNAAPTQECANCPPPRNYDNVEVIKNSRDVDQSRVINTESVVEVPPQMRESNKLIIRENETRNVGVVQHNHRIIEKHIRYVRRAPVYRHAAPAYRVQVQTVYVPVQQAAPCGCPCTCSGSSQGYGQAYAYPQAYAYVPRQTVQTVVQQVLVPVAVPNGYGYAYR